MAEHYPGAEYFDEAYFEGGISRYGRYEQYITAERVRLLMRFFEQRFPQYIQNSRILEIGCAYGYYLKALHERGNQVYGLDISTYAIGRARTVVLPERAEFFFCQSADARYPLPDESLDFIFSLDTIEHLPHPENMLAECHRVLRPGGALFVITPNKKSDIWVRPLYGPDLDASHINIRDEAGWRPALDQVFQNYRIEYINFESVTAPRWYLRLLAASVSLIHKPLKITHHLAFTAYK